MNELMIFEEKGFGKIRSTILDGEVWFVAKDVAGALGYLKTENAIKAHCKYAKLLKNPEIGCIDLPPRGMIFINEKDIFRLTMRSKLKTAEKFSDWVFDEVLPSIRKTGEYKSEPKPISLEEILKINSQTIVKLRDERDEAIRTKAMISDKKTAQAMATASHLSRTNKKLKIALDQSESFMTIKGVMRNHAKIKTNDWRILKKEMINQMQLTGNKESFYRKDIFDANYGQLKSWSAELWKTCFNIDISIGIN